MSLINDALKRASQSDKNRPADVAMPAAMQPAAERPRGGNFWLVLALAAALAGLLVAGWFLWQGLQAGHSADAPPLAQPVRANAVEAPAAPPTAQVVAPPAAAPDVAAATPDPDAWVTNLTVKAIIYSKTSPRALVNGKTVGTGDIIDGVLVTGILSDRIFVEKNGETREIKLGTVK